MSGRRGPIQRGFLACLKICVGCGIETTFRSPLRFHRKSHIANGTSVPSGHSPPKEFPGLAGAIFDVARIIRSTRIAIRHMTIRSLWMRIPTIAVIVVNEQVLRAMVWINGIRIAQVDLVIEKPWSIEELRASINKVLPP